jgi:beta-N-acetylhexosaminidase
VKKLLVIFLITTPLLAATKKDRWVERTLRSMTLDEKIGQMLCPAVGNAGFRSIDSTDIENVRRTIADDHVGCYHTFGGDPAAIALLINEMQHESKVPLLITADMEGGPGYVLFGATRMPLAMSIGATGDVTLAYQAAKITAQEGRAVGVNVNFYPVADVQNNPQNPIINIRSFGEDPARVSDFVRAYIRGSQENGEIATAKHFPGHGDVATDSHLEMPVLNVSAQRLEKVELPPFEAAVDAGVDAVMSAHIWLPQIEQEKGVPSTLSKNVITGVLRDELHFGGLVFTDAMTMRGVSANFTPDDATLRAVEAGDDIILHPPDVAASFNAIKSAVQSGRVSIKRIDDSVRRILTAKAKLHLQEPKNRFVDVNQLMNVVGSKAHRDFAQQVEDRAITLVRDERHVLPLRPSPDLRVVQINVLDSRVGWREGAVGRLAAAELLKRFPRAVTVQVDDQSTPAELDLVRKLGQTGDAVVVNGFVRVAAYKGSIDLTAAEVALLRDLAALKKPFVFTVFGSPYVLTHVPDLPSYIVTYDTSPLAEASMIKAITGENDFTGKLPISLPGLYPIGHGLSAR